MHAYLATYPYVRVYIYICVCVSIRKCIHICIIMYLYMFLFISYYLPGWWFGTFYIVPYIYIYIGHNNPIWLIFFRGVDQPPTSYVISISTSWRMRFSAVRWPGLKYIQLFPDLLVHVLYPWFCFGKTQTCDRFSEWLIGSYKQLKKSCLLGILNADVRETHRPTNMVGDLEYFCFNYHGFISC